MMMCKCRICDGEDDPSNLMVVTAYAPRRTATVHESCLFPEPEPEPVLPAGVDAFARASVSNVRRHADALADRTEAIEKRLDDVEGRMVASASHIATTLLRLDRLEKVHTTCLKGPGDA